MNALKNTGKVIIERVRDEAIDNAQYVISGELKSSVAQIIHKKLESLSIEDKESVLDLVKLSVDSTIHKLLWLAEESSSIDIVAYDNNKEVFLSEESDGLTGELYGTDGWIELFSKHSAVY